MASSQFLYGSTRNGVEVVRMLHCCHLHASLHCLIKNRGLLNCFSELDPILSLVQTYALVGYDNEN